MTILLAAFLLQTPQKSPTDAERLAALQLSQACRDAGDKFWQRGGYANQGVMPDYQTHYNRQVSKCLVRIVKMTDEPNNKTIFMMVFDAVDGDPFGSQLAKYDGKEYVVTYLDGYDGTHKHDPPTAADKAWFNDLMVQ